MYEEINLELTDFTSVISRDNNETTTTTVQVETSTTDNNNKSPESANTQQQITWLSHNSLLNCLFILTNRNQLILYDCNSKAILKQVDLNSSESCKGSFITIYF